MNEPRRRRPDALPALCVAASVLFSCSFSFVKHRPSLAAEFPLVDDPYDAVGSFANQIALERRGPRRHSCGGPPIAVGRP